MTRDYTDSDSQQSIVALFPGKAKEIKVLTKDFFSARYPEVSYDCKHLLFTARKNQTDPWQIWDMNLENSMIKQVTSSPENCIDPAYLPGERLLFSKSSVNDPSKYDLYTCNLDGSDLKKITFSPHKNIASTILRDGRVLTVNRQLNPNPKDPIFLILRPDGTKADMFYCGTEGNILASRGFETENRKIVFIESDKAKKNKGNIVTIDYNRPLHTRIDYTSEIEGDFRSAFPMQTDKLLVAYRSSEEMGYGLYEFDTQTRTIGNEIYNNKDYSTLEVVVISKHIRPRKLPSEVDMGVETGLLLCQDINFQGIHSSGNASAIPKSGKIEVLGIDSTLGVVEVEEDGSFYLKVIADTPFQIQTIDENGNVLSGPCDWIWLRPNERRGCIGCHEDPEMVPENRLPLSVKKPPVIVPVHISNIKEKEISLE
ncbi:MAG: hypothetical protein MUP53_08575 [Bacteroidales bacterium]|nr:hypothetical protein [Bacteroidales bacterium]